MNNIWNSGLSSEEFWAASRRIASICCYLGIQDAAQKWRPSSRAPGAWAGTVIKEGDQTVVTVDQDKWDKTRDCVEWLGQEARRKDGMAQKNLESVRGFLVYAACTSPAFTPYLKGIHHTLDGWRAGWDQDGWGLMRAEIRVTLDEDSLRPQQETSKKLTPLTWLVSNIEALQILTKGSTPP